MQTLSEEQIASGFYSRHQPHAWHVYIWASMCIHKECKSESGIITNLAKVKSAVGTMKRFWSSPTNPCLCTCSRLSIPCHVRLTRLMGSGGAMENSRLRRSFFFFFSLQYWALTKKKKREREVFFLSTAKKKKLKLYDCYKYSMLGTPVAVYLHVPRLGWK